VDHSAFAAIVLEPDVDMLEPYLWLAVDITHHAGLIWQVSAEK